MNLGSPNDIENGPILSEEFKAKMEERKKQSVAGLDQCDVTGCFCKEEPEEESPPLSGFVSGSQTPKDDPNNEDSHNKKIKKKMNKVKRALKSLGVNFYEFDDNNKKSADGQENDPACVKDFCRLGCVCNSISSKSIAPTHCGKTECMIGCCCSEDSVKAFANSRKVGISPVGAANLRSSSLRHLTAEEKKFHHSVVATSSGQDLVMLGSSGGRQKRERKVPSRYQDSDHYVDSAGAKEAKMRGDEAEGAYPVPGLISNNPKTVKLLRHNLRNRTIRKCAVLIPHLDLPDDTKTWCMFHCQYACPCYKFKNPLDFAPDRNPNSAEEKKRIKRIKRLAKLPPDQRPKPMSAKRKSVSVSARTTVSVNHKPNNKISIPHKVVVKKVPKVNNKKVNKGAQQQSQQQQQQQQQPHQSIKSNAAKLELMMSDKGSVQYVPLSVMKTEMRAENVSVWTYQRTHKSVVFVSQAGALPYVTNSENLLDLTPARINALPPVARDMLTEVDPECDPSVFVILTHNGIAWEVTGSVRKKQQQDKDKRKSAAGGDQNQQQQQQQQHAKDYVYTVTDTMEDEEEVRKLPPGQSLVCMQRPKSGAHPTMQIKLPATADFQHWCVIRVIPKNPDDPANNNAIKCPNSSMALKRAVLKHAAELAMKEQTTVRIPISVPGEVSAFGVYAVPGLDSHVFVGPFSDRALENALLKVRELP